MDFPSLIKKALPIILEGEIFSVETIPLPIILQNLVV
jgi:hypothetical protein